MNQNLILRRSTPALLAVLLMASVASAQQLTVTNVSPAANSQSTSGPAAVTITFSADVDASTVDGSTFTLVRAGADSAFETADDVTITPASISVNGATVTLDLAGASLPVDQYRIRISGSGVPPAALAGLFAHWNMDEGTGASAADSSGNGRHGTLSGTAWNSGIFGKAIRFYGGDTRVDINAGEVNPDWTAAMWVHRSGDVAGTAATLFDGNGPYDTSLRLEQSSGNDVGLTEYTVVDYGSGYGAPIGSWVHLAFTSDSSNARLYVNGALASTAPREFRLFIDRLGSALTGRSHSLDGLLDEVQIYTRILSDVEIASLAAFSGGVRSTSNRILDGDFTGTTPSGDGTEGGDFISTFEIVAVPPGSGDPAGDTGSGRDNSNGCGALGIEWLALWAAIHGFRRWRRK